MGSGGGSAGPIRAVALDLDGTLLDTVGEIAQAFNELLGRLAAAPAATTPAPLRVTLRTTHLPLADLRNMVGKGMGNLVQRGLTAATGSVPSAETVEHALTLYMDCYYALLGSAARPFPGVIEGLDQLHAMGLPLAVVTNKAARFSNTLLERTGLAPRFAHVVGGDTYERRKPDALPLVRTAERFGCLPSELLMIGDSLNDVAAARAAGCPVLCVPYGYNEGHPVDDLDFDGMIADLTEAPAWIRSRSGATAAST